MIPLHTKDKRKALTIISATMHLNLEVAQRASQSQEVSCYARGDNCE